MCRIECHRKTGDKKVGEGEADKEVVVDAAEARVEHHREDDEEVGEDGRQDHQHQRDRLGGGQHADDCELGQIGILLRKKCPHISPKYFNKMLIGPITRYPPSLP